MTRKEESKETVLEVRRPARTAKQADTANLERLLKFDAEALAQPRKAPVEIVIGTDEVGRGCLAGPVMAAAVILPPIDHNSELGLKLARLNDSKLVPPAVRAELANTLCSVCQFAIGQASVEEIDRINILQASLLAMKRAIRNLSVVSPAMLLIDGNQNVKSLRNIEQMPVIAGDSKSASIAAASIIAKVHRDNFMIKLASQFPSYKWDSNKGYQSKDHWQALIEHGISKWHRRTFLKNLPASNEDK